MTRTGPIFVAGCGRSGTSLIRTLLDAHPAIFIPTESLFIVDYLRYAERLPRVLWRWLLLGEPQLREWYDGPGVGASSALQEIRGIHIIEAQRKGAVRWGQKTPRFIRHTELLERSFGPLSWVFVYRDPRAVCASMRRSGQHSDSIRRSVRRWKRDNKVILRYREDVGHAERDVVFIKYEQFVENFEDEIDRVVKGVGVDRVRPDLLFENARPDMHRRAGFPNNAIRGGVIPDADQISAWRGVLSRSEVAYIERECGEEMRAFGYEPEVSSLVGNNRVPMDFWLREIVHSLSDVRIVVRYLRYWPIYPAYVLFRKAVMTVARIGPAR